MTFSAPPIDQTTFEFRKWLEKVSLFLGFIHPRTRAWQPVSLTDSNAPNNSVYYSITQSKLVYKDSGGTADPLE